MALISVGLLMLAGVGSYFGYASYADSHLKELNFSAEEYVESSLADAQDTLSELASHGSEGPPDSSPGPDADPHAGVQDPPSELASHGSEGPPDGSPGPDPDPDAPDSGASLLAYAAAYPGLQLHPKYWHEPIWAGTDTRQDIGLPDGFRPVSRIEEHQLSGDNALAHRIQIPMLRVDSDVSDLAILDLGDNRAYETPDNTVGHIPGTSDPGERGNGWFFGHLESPIRGEGNIFHRLPEIPGLLRNYVETGEDPVYISLTSADGEYLYVVTATQVVPQHDLRLYDSDAATVTLVTCVPRLIYDHRLLVTARLVGIRG